jgi:hypothetical protein
MGDIWEKQLKEVYGSFDNSILTMMPLIMDDSIDLMDDDNDGFCEKTVTYFEKFLNTAFPLSMFNVKEFESYYDYINRGLSGEIQESINELARSGYYCDFIGKKYDCELHFLELFGIFNRNEKLIKELEITYCGEILSCINLLTHGIFCYLFWTNILYYVYNKHKQVKYIVHNYWNEDNELSRKWKANVNMKPVKYYHHRVVSVL